MLRKPVKPEKFSRARETLWSAIEIASVISAERKRQTERISHARNNFCSANK